MIGEGKKPLGFNMVINFLAKARTIFLEVVNEGIVNMIHQLLWITHFFHVGKSLDAHSLHGAFKSSMTSMDNDLYLRIDLTELMKEFHALHIWQPQIDNGNVDRVLPADG